jgi:hypothetical protein
MLRWRLSVFLGSIKRLLLRPDRPFRRQSRAGPVKFAACGGTGATSTGTRSDVGRDCRDAFLRLAKTGDKLGIAVRDYLGSRLKVTRHIVLQPLDRYVRGRFRPA